MITIKDSKGYVVDEANKLKSVGTFVPRNLGDMLRVFLILVGDKK